MRDYLCLTKTLLVTFFRPNKQSGRERTVSYVVLIVLGAIFAASIAVAFAFMGPTFAAAGVVAEAATLLFEMGFVIVLIFGTIGIFSYVYFAKDSEFLFSLPVRNSTVYLSKLTVVYFQEFLISTLLMLPGLVALGIVTGQAVLFYVMILLAVTLVPVCPLFISSLVAIPMMAIASYFKNKGAVSAILLILLFAVVMGVYMYFVMSVQTDPPAGGEITQEELYSMLQGVLGNIARVLFPLFALARFGTLTTGFVASVPASVLIDLALFLGTVAVGAAVTIVVSGAVYGRSVLKQNEHAQSASAAAKEYVQGSALKALVKKEWRELIRNTSFAFQCLSGVIIGPVFAVIFMLFMSNGDMGLGIEFVFSWFMTLFIVQMMAASTNQSATTGITREGVSFAYSKSMPVPYATQMLAKIIVSDAISIVTVILSVIAMTATAALRFGYVDVLAVVLSFIFLIVYCMTYNNFCLIRDAKKPKLDWVTPREAIKGNVTIMVPTMIGFAVSIVCGIGLVAVAIAFTYFFDMQTLGILVGLAPLIIVGAVLLFISGNRIKNNADSLYAKLTV